MGFHTFHIFHDFDGFITEAGLEAHGWSWRECCERSEIGEGLRGRRGAGHGGPRALGRPWHRFSLTFEVNGATPKNYQISTTLKIDPGGVTADFGLPGLALGSFWDALSIILVHILGLFFYHFPKDPKP